MLLNLVSFFLDHFILQSITNNYDLFSVANLCASPIVKRRVLQNF